MKSYLLSALTRKYRTVDFAVFGSRHPHDWLLWEPGTWKPPGPATVAFQAIQKPSARPRGAKAAEALALVLNRQPKVTLGRDETCDLVINDGTLSSRHLVFTWADPAWWVEDAGSRNGSDVAGVKLGVHPVLLSDGTSVMAAQVHLTFYSPAGLWARLRA